MTIQIHQSYDMCGDTIYKNKINTVSDEINSM